MGLRAWCRARGVPVATLSKALAAGLVQRHPDGSVDAASADTWNASRPARAAAARRGPERSGGAPRRGSVAASQKRFLDARAKLAELELRRRRGELLEATEVESAMFDLGRRQRDLLQSVPSRLSTVLAGTSDADEVYTMLEKEMAAICDAMSLPAAVAPGKRDEHERP
jgi:phage terminase Nu1 subunit (DNA packaging protein)